jgi:hypothetical protein
MIAPNERMDWTSCVSERQRRGIERHRVTRPVGAIGNPLLALRVSVEVPTYHTEMSAGSPAGVLLRHMAALILNEILPLDLRHALDQDAEAQDITVNDAATKVLGAHYATTWRPSGFRFRPVADQFKLRVDDELHREIRVDAASNGHTVRGVTLRTLAAYYNVTEINPYRRARSVA